MWATRPPDESDATSICVTGRNEATCRSERPSAVRPFEPKVRTAWADDRCYIDNIGCTASRVPLITRQAAEDATGCQQVLSQEHPPTPTRVTQTTSGIDAAHLATTAAHINMVHRPERDLFTRIARAPLQNSGTCPWHMLRQPWQSEHKGLTHNEGHMTRSDGRFGKGWRVTPSSLYASHKWRLRLPAFSIREGWRN